MSKLWITSKSWPSRIVKVIVVFSVVAALVYWMKFSPTVVIPYEVERDPIVAEVMGTGTLEARVEATISPKIIRQDRGGPC
jgi:HlyD family secretion protein